MKGVRWWELAIYAGAFSLGLVVAIPGQPVRENEGAGFSALMNVNEETPDEQIARYTLYLFGATALLAIVAVFQGVYIIRADRESKRANDETRRSVNAFIEAERGRIVLHDCTLVDATKELPFLLFNLRNIGRTVATIDAVEMRLDVLDILQGEPIASKEPFNYSGEVGFALAPNEAVGTTKGHGGWMGCPIARPIDPALHDEILKGKKVIAARGYVTYHTVHDEYWTMQFFVKYQSNARRLIPVFRIGANVDVRDNPRPDKSRLV